MHHRKLYLQKSKPLFKVNIINLRKTWEKLLLAARAIAAVKIPFALCYNVVTTNKMYIS